jgi:DNA-binding MarR family transcriptional regulator
VRRCVAEGDRRGQVATLTDLGFEVLAAAAPAHVRTVRAHVIDRLTPEQVAQLEAIGRAIADGLSEAT